MDAQTIARCTGATAALASEFAQPLTDAMAQFEINTPRRQAAFLATVAVECENLSQMEEDLYYTDAARLAELYPRAFQNANAALPFVRNSSGLGKLLYGGYWGRGCTGLTWLKNYQGASKATGFDYVSQPGLVRVPKHAALTAGWFWDANNCNAVADQGDMRGVTLRVNGPALLKLAERTSLYLSNVALLGVPAESTGWGNEERR